MKHSFAAFITVQAKPKATTALILLNVSKQQELISTMHTTNFTDTKALFNKRAQWATLIDTLIKHDKYHQLIVNIKASILY